MLRLGLAHLVLPPLELHLLILFLNAVPQVQLRHGVDGERQSAVGGSAASLPVSVGWRGGGPSLMAPGGREKGRGDETLMSVLARPGDKLRECGGRCVCVCACLREVGASGLRSSIVNWRSWVAVLRVVVCLSALCFGSGSRVCPVRG